MDITYYKWYIEVARQEYKGDLMRFRLAINDTVNDFL